MQDHNILAGIYKWKNNKEKQLVDLDPETDGLLILIHSTYLSGKFGNANHIRAIRTTYTIISTTDPINMQHLTNTTSKTPVYNDRARTH